MRFQVSDIAPFAESTHTDAYVKLVFGSSDETPTLRTYTVHSINADDSTLAIDFVLHDDATSPDGPHDSGVACTWAAEARPGDTIDARGPGGGYSPDPGARRHLICGDATAIPAIIAAVGALPNDAQADVIVEAPDYADVDLIPNHPGTTTTHVQPRVGDDAAPGDALVEMATAVVAKLFSHGDVDPETVQVFVHGEAHAVMKRIRPMLKDAGITVRGASISGYWRHGRTEEAFREWKKENKPD